MDSIDNFSVLISVYYKEKPAFLKQSLDSLLNQTKKTNQIVLVKDGILTAELDEVINFYNNNYPDLFEIISLPENKGLGKALSIGILKCSNEIIARMDSDDICTPDRFQKQFDFLKFNPEFDIVGSHMEEFNNIPGDLNRYRKMPEKGIELKKYSKFRNPLNHPTIMFRKTKVLDAGNYNGDVFFFEDYSLFIRMLKNGSKFYNIQESLLYFRIGSGIEVIKRRSGWFYLKNEWQFACFSLKIKNLNFVEWLLYISIKLPLRLLPPRILSLIYNKILRD